MTCTNDPLDEFPVKVTVSKSENPLQNLVLGATNTYKIQHRLED